MNLEKAQIQLQHIEKNLKLMESKLKNKEVKNSQEIKKELKKMNGKLK